VAKPVASVAKPDAAAARERERARTLVEEGDATLRVTVEGAIEKYRQALEVEPGNLDALWKLSVAYEKTEAWAAVAATLQRALLVAPKAEYLRGRGHALVQLAREGDATAYPLAREPLERCLKVDAKQADCAYLLGEVEEWAEHAQAAAERYQQALQLDAGQARYYSALAALYGLFKQANEQERVLAEGMARVVPTNRSRRALARMSVTLAQLSAARHDSSASQRWLEQAEMNFTEDDPDLEYWLGSLYATAYESGQGDADRERALRLLNRFTKRTCRGAAAADFKEPCELSAIMIQVLGNDTTPRVAPPAAQPTVVPLPLGMPAPKLVMQPQRAGDAYTVWGASYAFRSRKHRREVTGEPIAITGYVVKTNFAEAPRCAVHRSGVADAEDCRAQLPTFWLGDRLGAPEADCIKVMGFASNFAQLFEAIRQADSQKPELPYEDTYWGQVIPNPLPARGAKLTVRGNYGLTFAKASSGAESDPTMGILDFAERDVLEPAPELETLPGVRRRKR
jgi:tetratricopeptide (TPR) repeat protein